MLFRSRFLTISNQMHIIYLTRQSAGEYTSPAPAQNQKTIRNSCLTMTSEQDGYFLFFIFRIETTSNANVSKTINSSYVVISIPSFPQDPERMGSTSSDCHGKYIILSRCKSYSVNLDNRKTKISFLLLPEERFF